MSTDIQHSNWVADRHPPRWLWLLLIALPIVALMAFVSFQATQVLPRLALIPGFSLTDQDGEQLTNEMLRGKIVLYSFTPTACETPCLETNRTLQQVRQSMTDAQAGDIPVHFVTFTSDLDATPKPTTERLLVQAQELAVAGDTWHFVSGNPDQFRTVLQSAEFASDASSENTPLIALVDGWGIVRALYPTAAPDLARIRHDLHLVAQEARNSTGVNRYAYEAVHLFMCHSDLNATTYTQPVKSQP